MKSKLLLGLLIVMLGFSQASFAKRGGWGGEGGGWGGEGGGWHHKNNNCHPTPSPESPSSPDVTGGRAEVNRSHSPVMQQGANGTLGNSQGAAASGSPNTGAVVGGGSTEVGHSPNSMNPSIEGHMANH